LARRTRADVVELIVEHGGSREVAEAIADALAAAGLSHAESRWWLAHPQRAYAVPTGTITVGGTEYARKQTPVFAIDDGHEEIVREEAVRFAAASEDERFISWWFGGHIDDVRRLTGGDDARAATIRAIAERLRNVLRKPEHVNEVVQTGEPRMADLILEGREDEVHADLAAGRIDPRQLLETGELHYHGW
jgi:hypothetical protein